MFSNEVLRAIRSVVGGGSKALHEPSFNECEHKYLVECLNSGYVSTVGKFVDDFELALASFTGSRNVIAVVNGTSALHLALYSLGVTFGDEVIIPTVTFAATANAVVHCGAAPIFLDCAVDDLNLDLTTLEKWLERNTKTLNSQLINIHSNKIIKAIVPMHTLGHICDMDRLATIANKFNLVIIEDAAEALGSFYKGKHAGTIGRIGILSFNGNKIITTGGGGAILTDDDQLATKIRHLSTTARVKHQWDVSHDMVGFNYRMPNINAALGCAQLTKIRDFVRAKRELQDRYVSAFEGIEGVKVFSEPVGCRSNYWLIALVLDEDKSMYKDLILQETNSSGIATRPLWRPMHQLKHFEQFQKTEMHGAEKMINHIINIPSSPCLI